MNKSIVLNLAGKIIFFEGLLLALPTLVALIYGEFFVLPAYVGVMVGMLAVGSLSFVIKPKDSQLRTREGLVIAGISWITVSLFGALPVCLCGDIPDYLNAVFEITSGFTTTGSTVLTDIEALSHATLFWRSFTHWIGGMGVLVFVLALLPATDPQSMHIMRAEMPGPTVGKLVAKTKLTARLLYYIYIALTAAELVLLLCGGMPFFDALLNTFATAGTGGFCLKNASIAAYDSVYVEVVITVFMLVFSINFNLFYLLLIGNIKDALRSEELRWFILIVLVAIGAVTLNITSLYGSVGEALRFASFQVASVISTTGFATADFGTWPVFSQTVLVLLMFIGACAGSTGGGIKVSRIIVMIKTAFARVRKQASPHTVMPTKLEGKLVDADTRHGITAYLFAYVIIFVISTLVLSTNTAFDLTANFTAVTSCINNIGPFISGHTALGNFAAYNVPSKIVLIFDMLAGRLEIFPMLAVFSPFAWKKY